jgi:molecular chaperone GrpE
MSTKDLENTRESEEVLTDNFAEELSEQPIQEDNEADELTLLKDSYLRLMAEYDNYRKRTIKEKADLIKNGGEKILMGLLPVLDDFERALESMDTAKDIDAVKEGVDLIYNKFIMFLQQNGVKAIETLGEPFDEDFSEAVALVPAQDEEQKGKVIDNVQTGYTLNDKVIRHAKVVVAD